MIQWHWPPICIILVYPEPTICHGCSISTAICWLHHHDDDDYKDATDTHWWKIYLTGQFLNGNNKHLPDADWWYSYEIVLNPLTLLVSILSIAIYQIRYKYLQFFTDINHPFARISLSFIFAAWCLFVGSSALLHSYIKFYFACKFAKSYSRKAWYQVCISQNDRGKEDKLAIHSWVIAQQLQRKNSFEENGYVILADLLSCPYSVPSCTKQADKIFVSLLTFWQLYLISIHLTWKVFLPSFSHHLHGGLSHWKAMNYKPSVFVLVHDIFLVFAGNDEE